VKDAPSDKLKAIIMLALDIGTPTATEPTSKPPIKASVEDIEAACDRLVQAGFMAARYDVDGKKLYRLTPAGRAASEDEIELAGEPADGEA
jgi:hypothetical protein